MIIILSIAWKLFALQLKPNVSFISWHDDSILIFVTFVWFQTDGSHLGLKTDVVCMRSDKRKESLWNKNDPRMQQWKEPVSVCLTQNKWALCCTSATKPFLMRNTHRQKRTENRAGFWRSVIVPVKKLQTSALQENMNMA